MPDRSQEANSEKPPSNLSRFFWRHFGGVLQPSSKSAEEKREGNLLDVCYWLSCFNVWLGAIGFGIGLGGWLLSTWLAEEEWSVGGPLAALSLFWGVWSLLWAILWKSAVNSSEAKYQHRKKLETQQEQRQSLEAQQASLLAQQQAFLAQQQEWLAKQQEVSQPSQPPSSGAESK